MYHTWAKHRREVLEGKARVIPEDGKERRPNEGSSLVLSS